MINLGFLVGIAVIAWLRAESGFSPTLRVLKRELYGCVGGATVLTAGVLLVGDNSGLSWVQPLAVGIESAWVFGACISLWHLERGQCRVDSSVERMLAGYQSLGLFSFGAAIVAVFPSTAAAMILGALVSLLAVGWFWLRLGSVWDSVLLVQQAENHSDGSDACQANHLQGVTCKDAVHKESGSDEPDRAGHKKLSEP